MKIHVYILCYNEEAIIRNTIEYYLTFCSKVFILDNYSTDKSIEYANSYENVTVVQWSSGGISNNYLNVKHKTETYKKYSRVDGKYTEEVADWIICCDMDELLYSPNILEDLNKCKELGITVPQTMGFEMIGKENINPHIPLVEQYRNGARNPRFDKRLIFDTDINIAYSLGAHPEGVGFEHMKKAHGYSSSPDVIFYVLHFKDVGSRFLDTAKKTSARIPEGQVKVKNGKYSGVSFHYQAIVDGKFRSRQSNQYPVVINGDGTINTNGVIPATGEQGLNSTNVKTGDVKNEIRIDNNLTNEEIDGLVRISNILEVLGTNYIKERAFALGLCLKHRPNGYEIENRLLECTVEGYKKRSLLAVWYKKFRLIGSILKC